MLFSWIFSLLMLIGIFSGGDAIYRGYYAKKGEFKYSVSIIIRNDHSERCALESCVGAVIDSRHILTAAHCVKNSSKCDLSVIAGVVNLSSKLKVKRGVSKIHIHKRYQSTEIISKKKGSVRRMFQHLLCDAKNDAEVYHLKNDIAVLTLDQVLPLGETIGIVNLPKSNFIPYCEYCQCAGWGEAVSDTAIFQELLWTQLRILDPKVCDQLDSKHFANQFCAINLHGESCPVPGDSGAALVHNNTVIGVTSYGCVDPTVPTVFSKVFDHLDFIREALKD